MTRPRVYIASSVKNPEIERVMESVGNLGFDYLDWVNDADPTAWERWFQNIQDHESWSAREHTEFMEHEQMKHIANCDYSEMDRCDIGVLVLPSGNSSHMELGYMIGQGKPCAIYFSPEAHKPYNPEPMRRGAQFWTDNLGDLLEWLQYEAHPQKLIDIHV